MRPTKARSWFTRLTKATAHASGRPITFAIAAGVVLVWAVTGPLFGFTDTWQLVINTGTTIVTFLMVFLIQSTQNRDTEAMQVKLDEIIRAIGNAKNELLDLEELEEDDLDQIRIPTGNSQKRPAAENAGDRLHETRLLCMLTTFDIDVLYGTAVQQEVDDERQVADALRRLGVRRGVGRRLGASRADVRP